MTTDLPEMDEDDYSYGEGGDLDELGGGHPDPGSRAWLVATAFGAVLIGAALLPLDGLTAHIVGYLSALVLAITLVALFRRASVARMLLAGIGVDRQLTVMSVCVLVAGLLVAVAHAYMIARHFK